jgi:hypothetical protein
MIFKIFSPKKIAKNVAFLTQSKAKLCKYLIITLVFEKSANFFAENWQKSQKIVIITSTPDGFVMKSPKMLPNLLHLRMTKLVQNFNCEKSCTKKL